MAYQRDKKSSPSSYTVQKKSSRFGQVPVTVQPKKDSGKKEMPPHTPLPADWVTNNPIVNDVKVNRQAQPESAVQEYQMETVGSNSPVDDKISIEATNIQAQNLEGTHAASCGCAACIQGETADYSRLESSSLTDQVMRSITEVGQQTVDEESEPSSNVETTITHQNNGTAGRMTPHQIYWGSQAQITQTSSSEYGWGQLKAADSVSGTRVSWGSSTGVQAITPPQPISAGSIQTIGELGSEIIGVAAIANPVGTDILTIQNISPPNSGRVGATLFPTAYTAPKFDFNTANKGTKTPEWYAQPTLKSNAFEGNVTSYYATIGLHKTIGKEGGKDIYIRFDAAMSNRDRLAEQEHCDDTTYAYKISLKEAEDVLKAHVIGKTFGAKPTEADAKQMVLDTIAAKLTYPALSSDQTQWEAKYKTLFRKTLTRDNNSWHTFGINNRTVDKSGNVIYDIVTGSTNVGTVPSTTIITY